eukprot:14338692-Alexandrium_andersonii.AAC.1
MARSCQRSIGARAASRRHATPRLSRPSRKPRTPTLGARSSGSSEGGSWPRLRSRGERWSRS